MAGLDGKCCLLPVLVDNTRLNWGRNGALSAFKSASQRGLTDAIISALQASCKAPGIYNKNGAGQVVATLQTIPYEVDTTGISDTYSCPTGGSLSLNYQEVEFLPDTVKQIDLEVTPSDYESLCCGIDEYLARNSNMLSFSSVGRELRDAGLGGAFGLLSRNVKAKLEGVLSQIETDAVNAIVAGVGLNPVTGSNAVQSVKLTNADGTYREDLNLLMHQMQSKMNACGTGKWILLTGTGTIAMNYFRGCKKTCCNTTAGLSPADIVNETSDNFDWYRSTEIDTLVSPNAAFLIAPDSLAFVQLINNPYSSPNITEGTATINGVYCNDDTCIDTEVFTPVTFQTRSYATDCTNGGGVFPTVKISIDTKYGFFTTPAGWLYKDAPYDAFTGIVQLILE
jgi:hypothetical protein